MRSTRALVATVALVATCLAAAQTRNSFRLVFTNAEITAVLRAISMKTGANIVFAGKEDVKISLSVTATSTADALRAASSAAGMIYRQATNTYIVAPSDNMKKALEPYGERMRVTLTSLSAPDAGKALEDTFPYITVRPSTGQLLLIGTRDDLSQARILLDDLEQKNASRVVNRTVYAMKHVSSKQAATLIKGMYTDLTVDALGSEEKTGGTVALSGPKESVEAALSTLGDIDVPADPLEPDREFEVYHVKYGSAPALKTFLETAAPSVRVIVGPESYLPTRPGFSTISGATIGGGSVSGTGNSGGGGGGSSSTGSGTNSGSLVGEKPKEGERAKSLVLYGTRDQIGAALGLLAKLDVQPHQVMVEVRVVDTSPEKLEDFGVKWDWAEFNFFENPAGTPLTAVGSVTRKPGFGQFSRLPWNVNALLDALVVSKEAKILASPSMSVVDGDEANIFIGETFRTKVATASGLGTQTTQIVEFPIGIALLIRPRVNADGDITMRIHPGVSTVNGVSDGLPQTSTREAETTVMIKHGETVVIGGLIKDEQTRSISEIPILAQLPLIGELFRHRSSTSRKSEVMVFITPRIVGKDSVSGGK